MFRNLPPLCRGIIIALVASAVLSLIVPTLAVSTLPLYPQLLIRGLQVWRVVTYPFFFAASMRGLLGNIFSLLWTGLILAMFGGELETIIHTKRLTIALATTIILGGILYSLFEPDGALAGPSIITMFMLGGFAYMWPKREISILGLFWVKAWMIALAVFVLSVIPMSGMQLDTSGTNLFGPIFGAFGAIAFLHVTYRQYNFGRAFLNRIEEGLTPKRKAKNIPGDSRTIQARIDAILDKIAEKGMDSLSKEEREFLLRNSK
jgi:membrane associated rhomboid family serine protease